jgi:adenine-specific DNA methylase
MNRPEVLIEKWLPLDLLSAEQTREKSMGKNSFPPHVRLHVWWARRPLLVSRAAILASLLPVWSKDWPSELIKEFPTEEDYHKWFVKACGILGDPVQGRKALEKARAEGVFIPNPYTSARAYTVSPSGPILKEIDRLLEYTWGVSRPSVADFFAGGGSIPFEALRYGFSTVANELNPVASVILKATLEYPFKFGEGMEDDVRRYGDLLSSIVQRILKPFFADQSEKYPDSIGSAFLWARTINCPYTGKPIPLSPNWWLVQGSKPIAVEPVFSAGEKQAHFRIVEGKKACDVIEPDRGTVSRGTGVSPWANNQPVDGDYIKAEAQAGRMGQQLYAIAVKKSRGMEFRAPTKADLEAVRAAEEELQRRLPEWKKSGLVPDEPYPEVSTDMRPHHYGMSTWDKFFSPRQLLSLCTYLEELNRLKPRILAELPEQRAKAVITYLAISLDKAADYNSRMVRWHSSRMVIAGTFDRHDFSFKWSHGEFDASANLFPWVIDQVTDAYKGLAKLASGASETIFDKAGRTVPVEFIKGSAAHVPSVATGSIELACVDPPYYDNVMYAECSDFFYVWMKRSLGDIYPEWLRDELTNKDDEAVANIARYADMGRNRKNLALMDYQRKMEACFREMYRVLREDGVLTVMFTHKKVEAWDTLATSLLEAGFEIRSSWPVHTESEHSLHQAKKNAAKSTILLTCRKRAASSETVWWDDIKSEVKETARNTASVLEKQGIKGVDLYIATFGPTLSILSRHWPVYSSDVDEETGNPVTLKPEIALDLAREEVISLRKRGLLLGRQLDFDPYTDWYLMAWDAFKAEEFPADEARKLALALGLDMDREVVGTKNLAKKKTDSIIIQQPKARRKKGMVDPAVTQFDCLIDAAHTAMLLYAEDGASACRGFLDKAGLLNDPSFKGVMQALLHAVPRNREKGEFVRPEAAVLDNMRLSFFPDLEVSEAPVSNAAVQGVLEFE